MKKSMILILLMSLLVSCSEPEPPQEIVRPVRYVSIEPAALGQTRVFSGIAKAGLEADLSFKVAGTVERLLVNVGDTVSAGDLIARLDATDYRLRVQEAEAGLRRAQAEERNAQSEYDRVQSLYENNTASRSELDAARAQFESAGANVVSVTKQLEQARRQFEYTTLAAPDSCAVASTGVEVNENVQAGQTIASVTCGGAGEIEFSVPENVISRISKDQPVQISFNAISDEPLSGFVSEVGVAVTSASQTYPVTAALFDWHPGIRPGMAAEVSLEFEPGETISVPAVAVGEDRNGRFVFVLEELDGGFGTARRRAVDVGELTAQGLQISSGLDAGDKVVTAGVSRITDGLKVRVP